MSDKDKKILGYKLIKSISLPQIEGDAITNFTVIEARSRFGVILMPNTKQNPQLKFGDPVPPYPDAVLFESIDKYYAYVIDSKLIEQMTEHFEPIYEINEWLTFDITSEVVK